MVQDAGVRRRDCISVGYIFPTARCIIVLSPPVVAFATQPKHQQHIITMANEPIIIIGAGVSGLVLAQYLQKEQVPFHIFERDTDLETRGVGWGLTLHWSLPALRKLLPDKLVARLPEAYVDRAAVQSGDVSRFPFFDLSTGELITQSPALPEWQRIRVSRQKLRELLATGLDIQVSSCNVLP